MTADELSMAEAKQRIKDRWLSGEKVEGLTLNDLLVCEMETESSYRSLAGEIASLLLDVDREYNADQLSERIINRHITEELLHSEMEQMETEEAYGF